MDKQYRFIKKLYLPPKVTSVAFTVEEGFEGSQVRLFIPLLSPSGGGGNETFSSISNSGNSFWGESSELGSSSNEGYGSFEWNWNE